MRCVDDTKFDMMRVSLGKADENGFDLREGP